MTVVSLDMAYRSFRGGSGRLRHPPRYAAFNQSSSPRFQFSSLTMATALCELPSSCITRSIAAIALVGEAFPRLGPRRAGGRSRQGGDCSAMTLNLVAL